MRRHLPNTLPHTDCTRRTTAGGRNRYARIGRGIANAQGAGQMNSSRRRCVTDLSLDGSAPVFSIVWLTTGSNDASAAPDCAAEFRRRSHATPTARPFSRLAKCGDPFGGGRFRRTVVYGGASVFRIGEQPPRYTVQSRTCAVQLSSRLRTTIPPREPA